jgi:hypothetical protein
MEADMVLGAEEELETRGLLSEEEERNHPLGDDKAGDSIMALDVTVCRVLMRLEEDKEEPLERGEPERRLGGDAKAERGGARGGGELLRVSLGGGT